MGYEDYTIGRGKVYLAMMPDENTVGGDWRFVGNTTSFKLGTNPTKKEHFASTSRFKTKDRSIVLGVDYNFEMITDNINSENGAMFFSNSKSTLTQAVVASSTEIIGPILAGHSYQLGVSLAAPSGLMGIDPAGFAVAVSPGGTALVEDVDYVMDFTSGMIHFLPGSILAVDAESIDVTYAVLGTTRDVIISSETQINASVKFIADNPSGPNRNWYIPKAAISPTGDYVIQSDSEDWQTVTFAVEALKLSGYNIAEANGEPV